MTIDPCLAKVYNGNSLHYQVNIMSSALFDQSHSIVSQLSSIRSEITIDSEGFGYASIRATSRLCGCARATLDDQRSGKEGILQRLADGKSVADCLKPFAGTDYKLDGKGVPDTLISALIYYFAVEAKSTNLVAKNNLKALTGISLRALFLQVKEEKPNETITLPVVKDKANAVFKAEALKDNRSSCYRSRQRAEDIGNAVINEARPLSVDEVAVMFDITITCARDYLNALVISGKLARTKAFVPQFNSYRLTYHAPGFLDNQVSLAVQDNNVKRDYRPQVALLADKSVMPDSVPTKAEEGLPEENQLVINRLLDLMHQAGMSPSEQIACLMRIL